MDGWVDMMFDVFFVFEWMNIHHSSKVKTLIERKDMKGFNLNT